MHTRTAIATLIAAAGLLALTGCEGGADTAKDKPAAARDAGSDAEKASLPDMTGKGLQSAQDQAQEAGFHGLTSHDALGRDRMQAFDRNWKVCAQEPAAGDHRTDTKVDFATVKLDETCPAKDSVAGEPQAAGAKMPDFKGKAVKVARGALAPGTSLTVNDASGQDRVILMESNWQVCSQRPAAGTKLDGQPVTLDAVKFEESC
ncbi:hypothetical protein [Streptomyces sp. NPDC018059]|uniref:hypothetical protein n=1 Tax=Streptomyces sp. NPDC018059 TaxID=3365041 RepID=UPI0037BDC132